MKPTRLLVLKRDVSVVKRGLRNAVKALASWIESSPDKETTKKRLLIMASVPGVLFLVGTEAPGVAIAAAIVLLFSAIFWFARTQVRQMFVHDYDGLGPFRHGEYLLDFECLLRTLAASGQQSSLGDLADTVCELGGPDLEEAQLAAQFRRYAISHPAVSPPSPAEPAPVSDPAPENAAPATVPQGPDETQETVPEAEENATPSMEKPQFSEAELDHSPTAESAPLETEEDPVPDGDHGAGSMMSRLRGRIQAKLP